MVVTVKCEGEWNSIYAPQILIVTGICCMHLHIHHMSRIPFLILSFLDFVAFVVRTLSFP